jgi:hypothetical protein
VPELDIKHCVFIEVCAEKLTSYVVKLGLFLVFYINLSPRELRVNQSCRSKSRR